eukprot:1760771-Rhodomonas_salina.1
MEPVGEERGEGEPQSTGCRQSEALAVHAREKPVPCTSASAEKKTIIALSRSVMGSGTEEPLKTQSVGTEPPGPSQAACVQIRNDTVS